MHFFTNLLSFKTEALIPMAAVTGRMYGERGETVSGPINQETTTTSDTMRLQLVVVVVQRGDIGLEALAGSNALHDFLDLGTLVDARTRH